VGRPVRYRDPRASRLVTRVLVTGATGFIGSAVMRRLAADGHEAIALAADLLAQELPDLAAIGATHCIHAAWYTNHSDYLTHPVNRSWVAASLRLAKAFPGRFVGLGTCLEYDVASAVGPLTEDSPLRPDTLYARCKLDLLEALAERGSDFAWARIFFVYGPGDRGGRLFPQMIERFARGEAAGPACGGLRRDYIHVDDLAGQIVRLATSDASGPVNTGTGEAPTLSQIYAAGAAAFGSPELALANPEIGGQPPLIQADLEHFRQVVGDPQARTLADGLRDLIG